ncbi:hypothetical protein HMPREF1549_03366 [Actinomyces johnsonii F0510]|uniref:Uncharacterized protein n=1 Tax=Actinomyces johnsonii F0510 TaxID=1227262 RepID=U1PYE6_9ACTO|nr:hypothetical protein HMPREF1549_03366 [Actinomyces johnsonii F0510]
MAADEADPMACGMGRACVGAAVVGIGPEGAWGRGPTWGAEAALGWEGMKGALGADCG